MTLTEYPLPQKLNLNLVSHLENRKAAPGSLTKQEFNRKQQQQNNMSVLCPILTFFFLDISS